MITVGPMQLHQPQAPDTMEPFFGGRGYHTDMSRISSHDHSGGLLGAPVAVTIPDGSITAADLDPSVLAPYALTDGSKPFTGQVTMQADAVVRDALLFGQQGTALAPDATLSRTGPGALRADTHLGVGVNPAAWHPTGGCCRSGTAAPSWAGGGSGTELPTTAFRHRRHVPRRGGGAGASRFEMSGGMAFGVSTAPAVAAGAVQTFTARAQLAPTGTLTLTPDAGQAALVVSGNIANTSASLTLYGASNIDLFPVGAYVHPHTDGNLLLGHPSIRWNTVYAVAGAINTSSREYKEGITPLDPARAMAAVRNTEAVTFDYIAPTRGPEWYDLPDDPEQAQQVLEQRLTAAPLEAAARHQHGFIAEAADPLFLVGEGQTSPGNSVGVLLAALQQLDQRVSQLEGA